jgi:probable HAF family extracellular repeat protein
MKSGEKNRVRENPARVPLSVSVVSAAVLGAANLAAAEAPYRIVDLTERAKDFGVVQAEVRGVNRAGECAGFELLEDYKARAIYWGPDGSVWFPPLLEGDNSSYAFGISADGVITGVSEEVTVRHQGDKDFVTYDQKAVIWREGEVVNLNDLIEGGDDLDLKVALHRNIHGQIVGAATQQGKTAPRGFLFEDGVVTDLGALARPNALNNTGWIVGSNADERRALLWDDGEITDLHRDPIKGVKSVAWGVNDAGWIVGEAQFHISKPEEATLWRDDEILRLVPEYSRPQGVAWAVNNSGQIIGWYIDLDDLYDHWHGFLWEDGERLDLVEQIPEDEGWIILYPFSITDQGVIAGGGLRNNELGHAFLMMRVIAGDVNCDGAVDFDDIDPFVLALTDPEQYGDSYPNCDIDQADVNGDGSADFDDIDPFVERLIG